MGVPEQKVAENMKDALPELWQHISPLMRLVDTPHELMSANAIEIGELSVL